MKLFCFVLDGSAAKQSGQVNGCWNRNGKESPPWCPRGGGSSTCHWVPPLPHCCALVFLPLKLLFPLSKLLGSRRQTRQLNTLTWLLPLSISELNEWFGFLERRAKFFSWLLWREITQYFFRGLYKYVLHNVNWKNCADFSWGLDQMACASALRDLPRCRFQGKQKK